MRDWWEENKNIHYTVYDPDTTPRSHDWVDTLVVAEAAIYSSDGTPKIGLYFLVTHQEQLLGGVTKETAIAEAERVIRNIAQEWRPRVEEQRESIRVLFDWRGQEIERRPVKR